MKSKKVFWKNEQAISDLHFNLERVQPILQNIVEAFAQHDIAITKPQQIADLCDSWRNADPEKLRQFMFDQMFQDAPLGMSRQTYIELVDLPDLAGIRQAYEPLSGFYGSLYSPDVVYFHAYKIEGGQVVIDNDEAVMLEANFIETASTPEELSRLEAVQDLCKVLDRLASLATEHPANFAIKGIAEYLEAEGRFVPGRLFVKAGGRTFRTVAAMNEVDDLRSKPAVSHSPIVEGDDEATVAAKIAQRRNVSN